MSEPEAPTIQSSAAEVWGLKEIRYGPKDNKKAFKVITQNFNGPCSFIAICNILILRGDIVIEPRERKSVSYEFLSQLVAESLLLRSPEVDISDALSIMPLTQRGMDLNPVFTSPTAFRPGGSGGELKLFQHVGIKLVHGWLVDPGSQEATALERSPDYDAAAALIAEVDHFTHGQFVVEENPFEDEGEGAQANAASPSSSSAGPSSSSGAAAGLSQEQQGKVADAIAVREFLQHTQSQLTYHGLFQLASTLEPGELVALFRNSHLSVLLKVGEDSAEGVGAGLYTLVTDQVFIKEPSVVWERLEDVDGGWSTFVDSEFVRASPAGGDFAGQTAEDTLRAMEVLEQQFQDMDMGDASADHELARQLQAEEEYHARQAQEAYLKKQKRLNSMRAEAQPKPQKKKSRDCIVM
ncbi:hypothetical protein DFP72DRAFT_637193 [Ephemerocybe angulata]|uniref:MINDY deubiquitinase domain-containing protein n=1 Tax=Ephemerocybe angulata TaxID=980116 RepID=A0A8H6HFN8_9AGAR|nr:hypothetical protein DFP72DRAFT_637193 [Tulosesus angulatus]